MNANQMLQQTGAVEALSRELGVDPATAQAGATALLPLLLSGFKNPVTEGQAADTRSAFPGLGGLFGMIGSLGGGSLLDNVTAQEATQVDKGNQILGQIFGSKDGSRAVAASAAAQSGVEPSLLKKMLPILAMVAAGYLMKNAGKSGVLGGAFGGPAQTDGSTGTVQSQPGGSKDILGELIGAAGKYLGR